MYKGANVLTDMGNLGLQKVGLENVVVHQSIAILECVYVCVERFLDQGNDMAQCSR